MVRAMLERGRPVPCKWRVVFSPVLELIISHQSVHFKITRTEATLNQRNHSVCAAAGQGSRAMPRVAGSVVVSPVVRQAASGACNYDLEISMRSERALDEGRVSGNAGSERGRRAVPREW